MPEPWASAMVDRKLVDPRNGNASFTRAAEAAEVGVQTLIDLVFGNKTTSPATVEAVAAALDVDLVTVSEWADLARTETKPYVLPPEAAYLTKAQQDAISALIRSIAPRKGRGSDVGASTKPAGRALKSVPAPAEQAKAARSGTPRVNPARAAQDAIADAPDEPGSDEGV